jgi:hypothetical protein
VETRTGTETSRRSAVKRSWRATGRDLAVLAWLGRWKCATADQVHGEFVRRGEAWDLPKVQRRLLAMREMGLVGYRRGDVADLPGLHWCSRDGMAVVGLDGPVVTPRVDEVHHDLAVVDLAAQIQAAYPGRTVVTEREIRATETPNADVVPDLVFSVVVESERQRRLFPDLATVTAAPEAGGSTVVVHEVERTRKPVPRLVTNMLAYVTANHVGGACYWCIGPTLKYAVRAAEEANARSEELGRGRKIRVRAWVPPRSAGVAVG